MDGSTKLAELKARMRATAGKGPSRHAGDRTPKTTIARVESRRDRMDSREKGSVFERSQAKLWSRWSGEMVRRTPLSGGWSNARFGVTGDLVCDAKTFPFHCELKRREGWDLADLVVGVRADGELSIRAWWRQCVTTCPKTKVPVLVFRRNRYAVLMMMRTLDWNALRKGQLATADFIECLHAVIDDGSVVIFSQQAFFKQIDYRTLTKQRAKARKETKA